MSDNRLTPKYLRKLRKGITVNFNGYDYDGVPHWMIHDEKHNKYFIIGWPEYEMLSRWHLGDPNKIVESVNRETTLHVELKEFEQLEEFLARNYLNEQRWLGIYGKAREQKIIKSENLFYWFVRYYLFFRIPLINPDNFLNKTKIIGNILFSKITLIIMTLLGIIAIYQISQQWDVFKNTFSTIFTWQGLLLYFITFMIAKFVHEFGHAYMCKQYGVSVPTMGVAFLVFWPVFYTDTTQSWSLPSHQRIRIALAGMWAETYITIVAALIWANVHNLTIQMICYLTVAINWVGTMLINVSPFMRFDGYYAFSDLLKMPNLQPRSFALARWQLRNWLFGWEEPYPEHFSRRMHWILVTYAFVTMIYRLIIYFGIAILVYNYFFKFLGVFLFAIEMFAFILRPIVQEIKTWHELRNQFTLNQRTVTTIIMALIVSFLLLVPWRQEIKLNGTLSYEHKFLYTNQTATLQTKLPAIGMPVKKDQIIAMLTSLEIDQNLKKTHLEYLKIQDEERKALLNGDRNNELVLIKSTLAEKETEYKELLKEQQELILRAPFDGLIGDVASNIIPGIVVTKNTWIADIINPQKQYIEAYVAQADINLIKLGSQGVFYTQQLEDPRIPVTVSVIEPINTSKLSLFYSMAATKEDKDENKSIVVDTPSYHASELGGKIATTFTDKGDILPVDAIYRIVLTPEHQLPIKYVQLGVIQLEINARQSVVSKIIYKIKRILVQESGF